MIMGKEKAGTSVKPINGWQTFFDINGEINKNKDKYCLFYLE
jgi:hypothetical protein